MTRIILVASLLVFCIFAPSTRADDVVFSTGNPDGLIATASRPSGGGKIEIETADDFFISQATSITGGTLLACSPQGLASLISRA